ncbi:PH domain-containing protein [Adhaeribacter terreus]|uniref:PH domain-containing protein n=1 Tax=Adhaeribacter terreus TaxID=529703 RepID=A0ABW0EEL8_9BACT
MVHTVASHYSDNLKFRSEKSRQAAFFIFFPTTLVFIMLGYLLLSSEQSWGSYFISFLYAIIYGYLIWMWFDTGYAISENAVAYHSGAMKGKIAISSIRKIERKKELFGGLKPALGTHGIIVHYNKFDDIYFSPENQEQFIQELKVRNPDIVLDL